MREASYKMVILQKSLSNLTFKFLKIVRILDDSNIFCHRPFAASRVINYYFGATHSTPLLKLNVILMRFFFMRYVKTSFVNFGPRPLFHQWPPGGALAVNSVNKSLFHGQFLGTRPKSNAILVVKAISNFVNF